MPTKKKPNEVDIFVGQRVRSRRMQLGRSQSWLAGCLDLTFQQIQKYEKGANRIGSSRLQQMAGILGVPASYFFEGAPSGTEGVILDDAAPDLLSAMMAHRDGIRMATAFMALTPRLGRTLVDFVEELQRVTKGRS